MAGAPRCTAASPPGPWTGHARNGDRYPGAEQEAQEDWDELEKSVVARVADDVKVSIEGRTVEMTILKDMA